MPFAGLSPAELFRHEATNLSENHQPDDLGVLVLGGRDLIEALVQLDLHLVEGGLVHGRLHGLECNQQ